MTPSPLEGVEKLKEGTDNVSVTLLKCRECGALSMSAKSHQHRNEWIECEPIEFIEKSVAVELAAAGRKLVEYRNRVGPLGFQLEKADDYIRAIETALDRFEKGVIET